MTAGRKPQALAQVPALVDAHLDQPKIDQAMAQMQADGVATRQDHEAALFDLGRAVGGIQMAQVTRQFSAVAEIKLFEEIKESNKFKDLSIRDGAGNFCRAENIDQFCRLVFGAGYKALNEESLSFRALGEASYEAANRLGLNRKQLRQIRSLPESQQTAIKSAIQAESKGEVVALIEDLAGQLAQALDAVSDAQAEATANEKLLATRDAKITRLQRHIAKATPDEVLLELQKEATAFMNDALGCVRGQLRGAVVALREHGEKHGEDAEAHNVFLAGLIGQVALDLAALREEFNLPDVSNAADLQLIKDTDQWYVPKEDTGPAADNTPGTRRATATRRASGPSA